MVKFSLKSRVLLGKNCFCCQNLYCVYKYPMIWKTLVYDLKKFNVTYLKIILGEIKEEKVEL